MKIKKNMTVLTMAVLLSLGQGAGYAAQAEPEPLTTFTLDEIVVTATRTENKAKEVPAATQVITAEEIKKTGSNSLRDLFSLETNFFQKRKVRGGGHEVMIRGMDTDKSLILVNGRRLANESSTSLGNANALDRINIHNVERVEIVYGPSSALYGSEAMGGVINIITKPSERQEITVGASQASTDANNWYHFDLGKIGKFAGTVDVKFNRLRRLMEPQDTSSNNYGTAQTYSFSTDYHFTDHDSLNVYGDYYSQHLGYDTGAAISKHYSVRMGMNTIQGDAVVSGDGGRDYRQQNYGISYHRTAGKHDWQVRTYYSKINYRDWSKNTVSRIVPAADPVSQMRFAAYMRSAYGSEDFNINDNRLYAIEARDTVHFSDRHRLTFGGEFLHQRTYGTDLGDVDDMSHSISWRGMRAKPTQEHSIRTYAGYVQDELTFGPWFIVPSLRYDHHERFGSHVSPRLGVTYNVSEHLRLKANYGTGFKAPTMMQLYEILKRQMGRTGGGAINWVEVDGNPNLKPEESRSFDIGVEAEFGKGFGSLTYFDTQVDNLIRSERIGTHTVGGITYNQYVYTNAEKAHLRGLESTLGYHFSDRWQFKVLTGWLSARDTSRNRDLTQRARLTQIYQLSYDDHKEDGWGAVLWNRLDYGYVTDNYEKKTYNLLNFTLTKRLSADTRIFASVENIFDRRDDDCDLDGRYWMIGVEHHF